MSIIFRAIVSIAMLTGSASLAAERELIYGSWLSPAHGLNRIALPYLFDGIERDTGGRLTWRLIPGGQLVSERGTPGGIRHGLIDAGYGIPPYVPHRLPATNMIFNTLVFGEDIAAATGAVMETVLLRCPQCLAEHRRNNAIPLAGYSNAPYLLMCRGEIDRIADVRGKKVRTAGAGMHLIGSIGAVPVAMSPAQATTALQRGTLDCVHGPASWLRSYGYADVVESIFEYPLGISGPAIALYFNRRTWLGLTPRQRQLHARYAAVVTAHAVMDIHYAENEAALAAARDRDVTIASGLPELPRLVERFTASQRRRNVEQASNFGVTAPDRILHAFDRALQKWRRLSARVGRDVDAYARALQTEIYDALDPEQL